MAFKDARIRAGFSVPEVSRILGLTKQTVYLWDWGQTHPSAKNLRRVSMLFGCAVDDLLE